MHIGVGGALCLWVVLVMFRGAWQWQCGESKRCGLDPASSPCNCQSDTDGIWSRWSGAASYSPGKYSVILVTAPLRLVRLRLVRLRLVYFGRVVFKYVR